MHSAASIRTQVETLLKSRIPAPFALRPNIAPETIATGVPGLEIPRRRLTEICGPASSGRTTLLLSLMKDLGERGELCALIDTTNAFDPCGAAAMGLCLQKILWMRCASRSSCSRLTPVERAWKAADLLVHAGGFGLIVLDLADVEPRMAARIPLAGWYRLRQAIEGTNSALLVMGREPLARSCAHLRLQMQYRGLRFLPTSGEDDSPIKIFSAATIFLEARGGRHGEAAKRPLSASFASSAVWMG